MFVCKGGEKMKQWHSEMSQMELGDVEWHDWKYYKIKGCWRERYFQYELNIQETEQP